LHQLQFIFPPQIQKAGFFQPTEPKGNEHREFAVNTDKADATDPEH